MFLFSKQNSILQFSLLRWILCFVDIIPQVLPVWVVTLVSGCGLVTTARGSHGWGIGLVVSVVPFAPGEPAGASHTTLQ
jgi:hypothetical protein